MTTAAIIAAAAFAASAKARFGGRRDLWRWRLWLYRQQCCCFCLRRKLGVRDGAIGLPCLPHAHTLLAATQIPPPPPTIYSCIHIMYIYCFFRNNIRTHNVLIYGKPQWLVIIHSVTTRSYRLQVSLNELREARLPLGAVFLHAYSITSELSRNLKCLKNIIYDKNVFFHHITFTKGAFHEFLYSA
jgi:hypothetical protein